MCFLIYRRIIVMYLQFTFKQWNLKEFCFLLLYICKICWRRADVCIYAAQSSFYDPLHTRASQTVCTNAMLCFIVFGGFRNAGYWGTVQFLVFRFLILKSRNYLFIAILRRRQQISIWNNAVNVFFNKGYKFASFPNGKLL